MERELQELIYMAQTDCDLEFIEKLIGFMRKYHRRLSIKTLKRTMKIVIEVLKRDVELIDNEGYIYKNFDYYILNLEDRYDMNLEQFKYRILYNDFSLKDIIELLEYININAESLTGDLDFVLRIPETLFAKELKLKNINEYKPSIARWQKVLKTMEKEIQGTKEIVI